MGYGILTVDFASIKSALCLPDNCEIIGVENAFTGKKYANLLISSPSLPNPSADHEIPHVNAICTQEIPENHICPDGFQCKKIIVRLEVSQY